MLVIKKQQIPFLVDCPDAYLYDPCMPRPRSDAKRSAILEAATRVIVTEGLSAPTAGIAKDAGVANGSLFTYFETKTDLFNQLYLELKSEMAATALKDLPVDEELRKQFFQVWQNWTNWAVSFPEKRQALAQLSVSAEITAENRAAGHKMMANLAELVERSRANGPMRSAPLGFVLALMNSVAEATMDYMTHDPANANKHCKAGFDALWRMVE
ncbi:MAG TPA: TetR/AcrR family transcriptional regulator [Terracidiphilus sp.]